MYVCVYICFFFFFFKEKLLDLFGDVFEVHDTVYVMDATAPGSSACRALKQYLADCKAKVTQVSKVMVYVKQVTIRRFA